MDDSNINLNIDLDNTLKNVTTEAIDNVNEARYTAYWRFVKKHPWIKYFYIVFGIAFISIFLFIAYSVITVPIRAKKAREEWNEFVQEKQEKYDEDVRKMNEEYEKDVQEMQEETNKNIQDMDDTYDAAREEYEEGAEYLNKKREEVLDKIEENEEKAGDIQQIFDEKKEEWVN